MKLSKSLLLVLVVFALLAFPSVALAQGSGGDKLILGGTYTLPAGEELNSNLIILGGSAKLEEGSVVDGDVMLAGGSLEVAGTVTGNILATGGQVSLEATAVVEGDVGMLGGNIDRALGAVVEGDVTEGFSGEGGIAIPPLPNLPEVPAIPAIPEIPVIPNLQAQPRWFNWADQIWSANPLWSFLGLLFRAFMGAALAVLVMLFVPRQVGQAAATVIEQPWLSGGVGCATLLVGILLVAGVAITLIGIPISFLGALALLVVWGLGLIALGYEIGQRLAAAFRQDWAPAVDAAAGTFLLILVVGMVGSFVSCLNFPLWVVVGSLGLGAMVLTRLGTRPYPPASVMPAQPQVPPMAYEPPAAYQPPTQPTSSAQDDSADNPS